MSAAAGPSVRSPSVQRASGYRKSISAVRGGPAQPPPAELEMDAATPHATIPPSLPATTHDQVVMSFEDEDGDEVPEMYESFRSDATGGHPRASSMSRRPLLPSIATSSGHASTLFDQSASSPSTEMSPSGIRGRPSTRTIPPQPLSAINPPTNTDTRQPLPPLSTDFDPEAEVGVNPDDDLATPLVSHVRRSTTGTGSWSRSRERERGVSKRRATIVFLGVWTLFGVSGFVNVGQRGSTSGSGSVGRIGGRHDRLGMVWDGPVNPKPSDFEDGLASTPTMVYAQPDGSASVKPDKHHIPRPPPPPPPGLNKHTIGRISAWMCTVLYLTSRLPQIWKNVSVAPWAKLGMSNADNYTSLDSMFGNLWMVFRLPSSSPLSSETRFTSSPSSPIPSLTDLLLCAGITSNKRSREFSLEHNHRRDASD